jgi:hypothetical protein
LEISGRRILNSPVLARRAENSVALVLKALNPKTLALKAGSLEVVVQWDEVQWDVKVLGPKVVVQRAAH